MSLDNILKQVDELKFSLDTLMPLSNEQNQALDRKLKLEFHYNSNHIEGNTLSYGETELLLIFDETRGNHSLREYEEMKASDVAFEMVRSLASDKHYPLSESFIKNLNKVLLVRPYWKEAITSNGQQTSREILVGDYKKQPNSVRLANGEMFNYSTPQETPAQMQDLIEWFRSEFESNRLHPAQLAAQFHYKFVRIHPFDDGNGRISRLLMNYVLFSFDYPPVIIRSDDKSNYLAALHDADTGNITSFEQYITSQLIWSLELSIKAAKGEPLEEKQDWKKRLVILQKELANKDTINVKKDANVIAELFNVTIKELFKEVDKGLDEFGSLFLRKAIIISSENNQPYSNLDTFTVDGSNYNKFLKSANLNLLFLDFTKNGFKSFSVDLIINLKFEDFGYRVISDGKVIFSKLYGQGIRKRDIDDLVDECATKLISMIESKIGNSI